MFDKEELVNWIKDRFEDVKIRGNEARVNSIFADDNTHDLWINTKKGVWRCWESDKSGYVYDLVVIVDKCSYEEAVKKLGGDRNIHQLGTKLKELKKKNKEKPKPHLQLPPYTTRIKDNKHPINTKAAIYLNKRRIVARMFNLMVCTEGTYANRIIIPYYNSPGKLVYFNGRDLNPNSKIRYLGPSDKDTGVGKGDVVWMGSWFPKNNKIYLTEGEFDAMTLCQIGFTGGACGGKLLGERQIELLRQYDICLAFDSDKAGGEPIRQTGNSLISSGIKKVTYVRPPQQFKDWNYMFICLRDKAQNIIKKYIEINEKPFEEWRSSAERLRLNTI
jgi:DNA primase